MSEESYQREYDAPLVVEAVAKQPRFGHSRDFTVLLTYHENDGMKPTDEQSDYVIGLIFAGAISIAVFLLWSLVLLVFMCCGQKRVGCLSGRPFVKAPPRPKPQKEQNKRKKNGNNDYSESRRSTNSRVSSSKRSTRSRGNESFRDEPSPSERSSSKRGGKGSRQVKGPRLRRRDVGPDPCCSRRQIIRIVFIVCGAIFIAFAALLVTEGLTNLQSTVYTVNYSAASIRTMGSAMDSLLDAGLGELRQFAGTVRDTLITELQQDEFCPAHPQETGDHPRAKQMEELTGQAVSTLSDLDDFLGQAGSDMQQLAWKLQAGGEQVEQATSNVNVLDWPTMIVVIFYMIVPCLLVAGAIMGMFDVTVTGYRCFVTWCVLPVFILLVILAWIVQAAVSIAAGMNTDFCLPYGNVDSDPDESVLAVVQTVGNLSTDSYVYRGVNWYVQQCRDGVHNPFGVLDTYKPVLESTQRSLQSLEDVIHSHNATAELSLYCGKDFTPLHSTMDTMKDIVIIMIQSLETLLDLFSCQNMVTIYTHTVYDGACRYSVSSLIWVYFSFLMMGFFGMIMLTCRAAYKVTEDPYSDCYDYDEDDDGSDSEFQDDDPYYDDDPRARNSRPPPPAAAAAPAEALAPPSADNHSAGPDRFQDEPGAAAATAPGDDRDDDLVDDDNYVGDHFIQEVRIGGEDDDNAIPRPPAVPSRTSSVGDDPVLQRNTSAAGSNASDPWMDQYNKEDPRHGGVGIGTSPHRDDNNNYYGKDYHGGYHQDKKDPYYDSAGGPRQQNVRPMDDEPCNMSNYGDMGPYNPQQQQQQQQRGPPPPMMVGGGGHHPDQQLPYNQSNHGDMPVVGGDYYGNSSAAYYDDDHHQRQQYAPAPPPPFHTVRPDVEPCDQSNYGDINYSNGGGGDVRGGGPPPPAVVPGGGGMLGSFGDDEPSTDASAGLFPSAATGGGAAGVPNYGNPNGLAPVNDDDSSGTYTSSSSSTSTSSSDDEFSSDNDNNNNNNNGGSSGYQREDLGNGRVRPIADID